MNVHASEQDEVMHGIGLRSSSHNQKSGDHGEHEVVGQCSPAVHHARAQKKVRSNRNHSRILHVLIRIAALFVAI